MIQIKSVRSGVLDIDSLTIKPGVSAITGPNGSGKTTLLKLLAGIIKSSSGNVTIDGESPSSCRIGWIGEYPDRNILFNRVYDEIASPLRFNPNSGDLILDAVMKISSELGISSLLERDARTLSTGQKILVSYATVLILKPEILILDETDSHMDAEFCNEMDKILDLAGIKYHIFSSHRADRVAIADEIVMLRGGKVFFQGPISDLHSSGRNLSDPIFWRKVISETKNKDTEPK